VLLPGRRKVYQRCMPLRSDLSFLSPAVSPATLLKVLQDHLMHSRLFCWPFAPPAAICEKVFGEPPGSLTTL
jgi:hypothetical protein